MARRLSPPKWDLPLALSILGLALLLLGTFFALSSPTQAAGTTVFINEIHYDDAGADSGEAIEIAGPADTDLSGWSIVLYNGGVTPPAIYNTKNLSGVIPDQQDGYGTLSFSYPADGIQNGTKDGIALVNGTTLIQFLSYEGTLTPTTGPAAGVTSTDIGVSESGSDTEGFSLQLTGTGTTYEDFSWASASTNTFGAVNTGQTFGTPVPTPTPEPECGNAYTPIYDIQGSGTASALDGTTVSTEGVVTAEFQGASELSGFYIQDPTGDNLEETSDGIFVYSTTAVTVGNSVRVSGTVDEYFNLTELTSITRVEDCGLGTTIDAVTVTLPVASTTVLEQYEGMLVTFDQELTVVQNYFLGRYGELVLASERLWIPTHLAAPGDAANALAAENDLKLIFLDDYSTVQNPDPVIYPSPYLSATNTLRVGDTVTNVTGVVHYDFDQYRIQPTITPSFVASNPRPASPDPVAGTFRVASFNVLNYFNGNGLGGGFPTSRGADTSAEFTRQRDKIIAAILGLEADVIGLMEIENDGYSSTSAIQDLVNGLNDAAPGGTSYDFIDPGLSQVGSDEITVGFIYRVESAEPVGAAATTGDGAFSAKNRQPLAQTFRQISTDGLLTVAVNHFKSKGSDCEDVSDPDTGDGQGNCNLTRVAAANDLVEWLESDPTGSGDADFLIIGDLNSYAQEDPITAIKNAGYTNLLYEYHGDDAYSYVFDAETGYLDHALATSSLATQVTGAGEWHINADEPSILDYDMTFKSANQDTIYYEANAYRSSDHDPVLVGMALDDDSSSVSFSSATYSIDEGAGTATITATLRAASALEITVPYTVSNGTATDPSDYISSSDVLTFTPGMTSATFTVPITEDVVDEANETVNLTLGTPSNTTLGTPSSALLTILDNDSATVQFDNSNYTVAEAGGSAIVTATLDMVSAFTVTAQYTATNGTATGGSDYTASTGTITFTPGFTSTTFSIPITEDVVDEANETVLLALGGVSNATLGSPSSATLTILDDDSATVQLSSNSYSVTEGAGSATVTVTLSTPSAFTVTVNYATSDVTATNGSDYTASSGVITFTPNSTIGTFTVPITGDALDEDDEALTITLSGASGATLDTPDSATLTIQDDDSATAQFDSSTYTVSEGTSSATVTVTLSTPSAFTVTVDYATSNGSATVVDDYSASSGTLTFAPNSTTSTFTVSILNDLIVESDETINLALSAPDNATLGSPSSATLTIEDNDSATVQFDSGTYTVSESGASVTVTATLSTPSASTVTVNYATSNGTATSGSDYTASSGTLSFAPGTTSTTFSVSITNDTVDENDETLTLTLSGPSGASLGSPSSATLTIEDNDSATVQFSSSTYSVGEGGGSATVTATLSTPSASTVTVNYATSNGTATSGSDYSATSGTLTFAPNSTTSTFTVSITDDAAVEADETVNLTLSGVSGASLGSPSSAILTIFDNDVATPTTVPVTSTLTATPVTSTPVTTTPVTSTPVTTTPVTSTPVTATPVTSTPVTTTPVTSTPVTTTPVTSTPVTTTPVTSTPVTTTPVTSTPVTTTPVTSTPVTTTPVTATPITPSATPVTPSATPVTATPVTPSATPITPSATPITPSATPVTATPVTPSATPITPSATPVTATPSATATATTPAIIRLYLPITVR